MIWAVPKVVHIDRSGSTVVILVVPIMYNEMPIAQNQLIFLVDSLS